MYESVFFGFTSIMIDWNAYSDDNIRLYLSSYSPDFVKLSNPNASTDISPSNKIYTLSYIIM